MSRLDERYDTWAENAEAMPVGAVSEQRAPAERTWLRARLIACDVVAALTLGVVVAGVAPLSKALLGAAAGAVAFVFANRVQNLYRSYTSAARLVAYAGVVRSALVAAVASRVALGWAGVELSLARTALGAMALIVVAIFLRSSFDRWLSSRRESGRFRRTVVAIGDARDVAHLDQLFRSTPSLGYDLVAAVGPCDQSDTNIPWFGDVSDAAAVVRLVDATGVMVCPAAFGGIELRAALRTLQADGVHVHVASGLEDVDHRRLRAVGIGGQPFLYLDPPSLTRSQLCAKRVLDVVLASVLLLVALPVLVVAAAAVKLGDGGPIMFRQERVGRDGRRFRVHKLRTMEVDAEARLGELVDQNERSGPLFKIAQDPRVTRVGRFLRTSSIDELPQLLDVLRGSMSLVGPRPALPREVELFDEELLDRLRCTPGVTGLWQVEARDEAEFEAYRHLDLYYVENWSLLLDLTILARTIPAVVGRGLSALRSDSSSPAVQPEPEGVHP